jgi:integrase
LHATKRPRVPPADGAAGFFGFAGTGSRRPRRRPPDRIPKRASCHTFRHSFATHLLEDGYDIRTIQEPPGHTSVRKNMIYTHVLSRGGRGVRSPADRLFG